MVAPLFAYQTRNESYVDQAKSVYSLLALGVNAHCGGFEGRTVLDVGVGFQLIHGGLTLPLAIRDGASRAFGIDIANPAIHATEPHKVEFWKAAREMLNVDVQGLDEGRVYFGSTDILHQDDFFSRIELLQMSASNMWFKDDMFDLAISNAVFEHVQKPKAVLAELFRVLKPGGSAFLQWNPYTGHHMGGHDIGIPYFYPWAQLRLSKDDHIAMLRKVMANRELYEKACPPEHMPTPERAAIYANDPALFYEQISYDLNKMRIAEFLDYARAVGFEIIHQNAYPEELARQYLTSEVRAELSEYSEEELLCHYHSAALKKPHT